MKDHRPPSRQRGKLVWKDETTKAIHDANVKRMTTLPYYINAAEPTKVIHDAMIKGPGTGFLFKISFFAYTTDEGRIADVLHADVHNNYIVAPPSGMYKLWYPRGTFAMYAGQIRSPEAKWGNVKNEEGNYLTEVLAVRHLFIVGGVRCMIIDLNEQFIEPTGE